MTKKAVREERKQFEETLEQTIWQLMDNHEDAATFYPLKLRIKFFRKLLKEMRLMYKEEKERIRNEKV